MAPAAEAGRLATLQHQLTLADFASEAHDTHHPIGVGLYYEQQKREAKARAAQFVAQRIPKFLGYFESLLATNHRQRYLVGAAVSYADLSLFQLVEGLGYAFPNALAKLMPKLPLTAAHRERIAARPRLAAYLRSPRRIPWNEQGLFRRYPELDAPAAARRNATRTTRVRLRRV